MSDGVNSSEIGIIPKETPSGGRSLYRSSRFAVFVPSEPKIPLNEGLHVQVSSGHDQFDPPKEVLGRYVMALGSAKALAESSIPQDAWANTRLEQGQVVSTYGRVPTVEGSWRKPVETYNREVETITTLEPYYKESRLQELFGRYLPKWEQLVENINLFRDGVNGKDIDSGQGEEIPVWENDKFTLLVISHPHLKGVHLVVHPKESFRRQWQTIRGSDQEQTHIQATLEATAIAMGAQRLLAEGRGEIHNSGNWASGLKSKEEGGKFDLENFEKRRKAEKRSHRPDIAAPEEQIDTGMHVHVYIPESGPVVLPPMSKQEAMEKGREDIVKQWEAIPSMTQEQIAQIREKIGNGKLATWIETNARGTLH